MAFGLPRGQVKPFQRIKLYGKRWKRITFASDAVWLVAAECEANTLWPVVVWPPTTGGRWQSWGTFQAAGICLVASLRHLQLEASMLMLPATCTRSWHCELSLQTGLNSILMVLVDLDVHQIVGYHYFDHHQPSRGGSVKGYFRAGCMWTWEVRYWEFSGEKPVEQNTNAKDFSAPPICLLFKCKTAPKWKVFESYLSNDKNVWEPLSMKHKNYTQTFHILHPVIFIVPGLQFFHIAQNMLNEVVCSAAW